ncbi:MAG: hypothetical protein LBT44_09015 [Clostridiales bacterium]|jgi:hypothetical protein|nr:hypothetical protein [Clostridiales bacterium]
MEINVNITIGASTELTGILKMLLGLSEKCGAATARTLSTGQATDAARNQATDAAPGKAESGKQSPQRKRQADTWANATPARQAENKADTVSAAAEQASVAGRPSTEGASANAACVDEVRASGHGNGVISLEDFRTGVGEKSRNGKRDAVKHLLNEFGYTNVTEVPEDKRQEFLDAIETL